MSSALWRARGNARRTIAGSWCTGVIKTRLQQARDWPLLKELWAAVVAKRRTNHNKTRTAQKSVPDKIPQELVTKTRDLLLESLRRLQRYASELGHDSDVAPYVEMMVRVEKRMKA